MYYTIVVLTRAEGDFDIEEFLDGIEETPVLDNDSEEVAAPQHVKLTILGPNQPCSLIKKFLIHDIDKRVIGVNNASKSSFEKNGMRDAVIELIDVVQTQQEGKPFSHLYFVRAKGKLEQRREKEEMAREKFAREECERCKDSLDKAEKKLVKLLDGTARIFSKKH